MIRQKYVVIWRHTVAAKNPQCTYASEFTEAPLKGKVRFGLLIAFFLVAGKFGVVNSVTPTTVDAAQTSAGPPVLHQVTLSIDSIASHLSSNATAPVYAAGSVTFVINNTTTSFGGCINFICTLPARTMNATATGLSPGMATWPSPSRFNVALLPSTLSVLIINAVPNPGGLTVRDALNLRTATDLPVATSNFDANGFFNTAVVSSNSTVINRPAGNVRLGSSDLLLTGTRATTGAITIPLVLATVPATSSAVTNFLARVAGQFANNPTSVTTLTPTNTVAVLAVRDLTRQVQPAGAYSNVARVLRATGDASLNSRTNSKFGPGTSGPTIGSAPDSAVSLTGGCNAVSGMTSVSAPAYAARVQPSNAFVAFWEHQAATGTFARYAPTNDRYTKPYQAMVHLSFGCVNGPARLN